jgi:hypothetical protein
MCKTSNETIGHAWCLQSRPFHQLCRVLKTTLISKRKTINSNGCNVRIYYQSASLTVPAHL